MSRLPSAPNEYDPSWANQLLRSLEVDLSPVTSAGVAYQYPATGAVARGVDTKLAEQVSVRDFGAAGNGTTDDSPAFQKAVNALGTAGGIVHLQAKPYRLNSAVTIAAPIIFQGQGFQEGPNVGLAAAASNPSATLVRPTGGTWLIQGSTAASLFSLTSNQAQGSRFRDFAVWQDQPAPGPGWVPTVYVPSWTIAGVAGAVGFDNIHLHNVYHGIQATNTGRIEVTRLQGQPLYRGITIDSAADKCWLDKFDFWVYWTSALEVGQWMQQNGIGVEILRVDGFFLNSLFAFCYKAPLRFGTSGSGNATRCNVGDIYADYCKHGVLFEAQGSLVHFGSIYHFGQAWPPTPSTTLSDALPFYVTGSNTRLIVESLDTFTCPTSAVRVEGTGNALRIGALRVPGYNASNTAAPCIDVVNAAAANLVLLGYIPNIAATNAAPLATATGNGRVSQPVPQYMDAGAVNTLEVIGGIAGGDVELQAAGSSANVDLRLSPRGTGLLAVTVGGNVQGTAGALAGYFKVRLNSSIYVVPYYQVS